MSTQTTTTQAASGAEDLRHEATFLLARLRDFENDGINDDNAREWYGHVTPSIERLRALATSPATAPQSHPREERGQAGEGSVLVPRPQIDALAKLTEIPPAGSEECLFWLEAAEQHGFSPPRSDLGPGEGLWLAWPHAILKLMSEARKQGQQDVLAAASPAAPVTGTDGERSWLPMKDAPTGVPIIAKHKPNARMPLGWVGTIKLGHGDEEKRGALDTILHYNGDALIWNFHGCWEGWLPFGSAIPVPAPQPAGAERVDLGELERLSVAAYPGPWDIQGDEDCELWIAGPETSDPGDVIAEWPEIGESKARFPANAAFIVALANAFRAGHLVPASLPAGTGSADEGTDLGAPASPSGHSRAEPSGLGPLAECPSRGRFINGVEDLPSEGDMIERGMIALPDSIRYDIEREARNIVNVFVPDAPPALEQSIKAALFRAEKRRIRDVRDARVSDEHPGGEDAIAAEGEACQRGGEAETPQPDPVGEAKALLEGLPKWLGPQQFIEVCRKTGDHKQADRFEAAIATLTASQEQDDEVRT